MAGDWIKVEIATADKPEVIRLARMLKMDRYAVFGRLVKFWAWVDAVSVDGHVDGIASTDVDALVDAPAFAKSLEAVGWLKINDEKETITIPNFDRHNGKSAKNRALKTDRQRRYRENSVDALVDAPVSTREEKRREEKSYRYKGRVVRLNDNDYESWKTAYHAIPDFETELAVLDAYYATNRVNDWFNRCSRALANKHQEFVARSKKPDPPFIPGVSG